MTNFKLAILITTVLTTAACSPAAKTDNSAVDSAPAVQTATAPAPAPAAANTQLASGTFSGRSDHITTGSAAIIKTDSGYQLVLSEDFELDGAPDPVVAFGNNETFENANKLGALKNRTGAQSYALPAHFSPAKFSQVYIWCEKFSVPLGVAGLSAKAEKYGS